MPRAKVQRETIIRFSPRAPEAVVSSSDPAFIKRMKKLNIAPQGDSYRLPKEWVRIAPPRKLRLSEDERERRRAILVQNTRSETGKRYIKKAA